MDHLLHYTTGLIPYARRLRRDMTLAERKLWSHLRNNQMGVKFRRQCPFDEFILDFYCVKVNLVIEVDGSQHYTPKGLEKDGLRDKKLNEAGLDVLHFSNIDVLKNISGVIDKISDNINKRNLSNVSSAPTEPNPQAGSG